MNFKAPWGETGETPGHPPGVSSEWTSGRPMRVVKQHVSGLGCSVDSGWPSDKVLLWIKEQLTYPQALVDVLRTF